MRARTEKLSLLLRPTPSTEHQRGINRLLTQNSSLFSAGRDGIIRQWDQDSLSLSQIYDYHIHWVNDIQLDQERNLLFSASSDSSIMIWPIS